jgi:general secretion pathway protein D
VFWLAAAIAAAAPPKPYKEARRAHAQGDHLAAYLKYSQALAQDPGNPRYWGLLASVRRRALESLPVRTALQAAPSSSSSASPESVSAPEPADPLTSRELLPPPALQPAPGRRDFDLRLSSRKLFEAVAKEFGLDCVFDGDYPESDAPRRLVLQQASAPDALRALETLNSAFLVPISPRIFLVARDTQQKRLELEPAVAASIPLDETVTPQDLQEAINAARLMFDMTRIGIDNSRRQVVLRDRVSRVRPAAILLQQLMRPRAEIFLEVELLGISRNSKLSAGLRFPTGFPLAAFGDYSPHTAFRPAGLATFFAFGAGKTLLGLGITDAQLFASLTRGEGYSLLKTGLRGQDGQPAEFHAGDRYPIVTLNYIGSSRDAGGTVYQPPPNVQFEDLGIVAKMTPRIHSSLELSLELDAEFKALTGQSVNEIPVIANRKINTKLRLRFNECVVVSGFIEDSLIRSWSGLLPILNRDRDARRSEFLLVVTPRLVTEPASETPTRAFWVGSEARLLTAW